MPNIQIPAKFKPFLEPHRYKIAYGGRGGAKSRTIARLLVQMAARQKEFVVCGREFQNSIEDSVYRLLEKVIHEDNLPHYDFTKTTIRNTKTGSEFVFKGLSKLDGVSIKSLEGATKLWIEEGQNISHASMDNVFPTIREKGSEIWVSFNTTTEQAPVWQRLVLNPHPDSAIVKINWDDNPWFPEELEEERKHMLATDPEKYRNIWEGEPLTYAEGAYWKSEFEALERAGRIGDVPYDPNKLVFTWWDLSHSRSESGDPHAVFFIQSPDGYNFNVIDYWEGNNTGLTEVARDVILNRGYTYGKHFLPHDARNTNSQTGKSDADFVEGILGANMVEVIERTPDVERDLNNVRIVLPRCRFDEKKAKGGIAALRNHRRELNEKTGLWSYVHDWTSHGAAAFRGFAVHNDRMVYGDSKMRFTTRRTSPMSL